MATTLLRPQGACEPRMAEGPFLLCLWGVRDDDEPCVCMCVCVEDASCLLPDSQISQGLLPRVSQPQH